MTAPLAARVTRGLPVLRLVAVVVATAGLWTAASVLSRAAHQQRLLRGERAAMSGEAALGAGRVPLAVSSLREAVALEPDRPEYRLALAKALVAQGRNKEALPYVNDVLRQEPVHGEASLVLARILRATGARTEAESAYYRAIFGRWAPAQLASRQQARLELVALIGLAFAVGTPGGLFAPTLFLGVMLGGAFGGLAPELLPMMPTSPSMLALAGMAGVFAGVFRAPMTAVFMTFELSGTSASILPAMVTSTLGFLIARQFQRTSILDMVAAHEGANLPSSRLARAEEPLHVEDVLQPVSPSALIVDGSRTLREALAAARPATRHVLVNLPGHVWGVAPLETIEALAVTGEDATLDAHATLARVAPAYPDELLDVALRLLGRVPVVPVVSRLDEHQVLGVVTIDDVKRAYRLT